MGERTSYEPGTFCWAGLATSDPARAKAFYTSLFGWQTEDLAAAAAGTYTALRRHGKDVAILHRQMPDARAAGAPPYWTSYISVEDADATAAARGRARGCSSLRNALRRARLHGNAGASSGRSGRLRVVQWEPAHGAGTRNHT